MRGFFSQVNGIKPKLSSCSCTEGFHSMMSDTSLRHKSTNRPQKIKYPFQGGCVPCPSVAFGQVYPSG